MQGRHFILFVRGGGVAAYLPCRTKFALAKVGNVGMLFLLCLLHTFS